MIDFPLTLAAASARLLSLLPQAASDGAWISEQTGIYIGAFGGAGLGVLGGLIGVAGGVLAPRGQARGLVLGIMVGGGALGVISLLFGSVALIAGQPYAVWYPFTLLGFISGSLFLGLVPVVRKRYAEAEHRKMEAESLRNA